MDKIWIEMYDAAKSVLGEKKISDYVIAGGVSAAVRSKSGNIYAGVYAAGDTVTLTAIPNAGYIFDRWSDGILDNPRTIVVTENVALVANFVTASAINEFSPIDVVCYPNPTMGGVRVNVPGKATIRVYDTAGRLVGESTSSSTIDLDFSSIPSGIYLLQVLHSKGCVVKKVVKE